MASLDQIAAQLAAAGHPKLPEGHPRVSDNGKPHRYGPGKKFWYSIHQVVRSGQVLGYIGAYGKWVGDDNGSQTFEWQGEAAAPEDLAATRARQAEIEREDERKRLQAATLAANRARSQWQNAFVDGESAYLQRKQITPEGVRFDVDGTLFVPMYQYDRDEPRMVGLQKVTPDGAKRFNKGMEKKGTEFRVGEIGRDDRIVMLAEGYLLDTGVTSGPATGVQFLQRALNVLNNQAQAFPDLIPDGGLGNLTFAALRAYIAVRGAPGMAVLRFMVRSLRSTFFIELAEKKQSQESFEYGWQAQRAMFGA